MKWILSLLLLVVPVAHAQGPDQEYIRIYNLISQGDTMSANGETRAASLQYRDAQNALKRLQSIYPQWNQSVVKFRLEYLDEKLRSIPENITTNAASSVVVQSGSRTPLASNVEVQRLKIEKKQLEAKLKEALSIQPNVGGAELSKAEEKLVALEKERDLLKVALEQEKQDSEPRATVGNKSQSDQTKELEQLRARLAALEARPDPYSAEELALFKQSAPEPLSVEKKPATTSKDLPPGSGALVAQAERAFASRRFEEAEKKYKEVLQQDEENVHLLGNLAATQLELNNISNAEATVQRALRADPEDPFALTLLGIIKFRQNDFDEALNVLSRSARINPENPETQNYLGITLSQKGQRAAAEAALRKAIKIQPNYAGAHHNLAVIYATQKPPFVELARWHYDKAIALGHTKNADLEKLIASEK